MPASLRRLIPALAIAAIVLGVAAIGQARAATHAVEITDFTFAPAELTVVAGDTVTWTNLDPVVHTATSTTGAFDSGDLAQGASYSVTFTTPGTYDYLCTPHPQMTGRIIVVAAAAPPAPTAAPTTGAVPNVAVAPDRGGSLVWLGAALILIGALGAIARVREARS